MTTRIALIAHDHKKDDIVALAGEYVDTLRRCDIIATVTTGGRISDAHGLQVERMLSGPHGGDLQIGAQLAEGRVDMVIFLRGAQHSVRDQYFDRAHDSRRAHVAVHAGGLRRRAWKSSATSACQHNQSAFPIKETLNGQSNPIR